MKTYHQLRSKNQIIQIILLMFLLLGSLIVANSVATAAQLPKQDTPDGSPNAPTLDEHVYLPLVIFSPPPVIPTVDLTMGHIEVTQATQTLSNNVPLVAERPTVLRLFAHTTDSVDTEDLQISLDGVRDGQPLPGSPIIIDHTTARYWESEGELENFRADLANSANIQLPAEWLTGIVTITATVDANHVVPEISETNNQLTFVLEFNTVPPLEVVIVPIRYIYGGFHEFPPVTNFNFIPPRLMSLFPIHEVNLSTHSPINFSGDLYSPQGWSNLLDRITSLRRSEVGNNSPVIYYGVVPLDDGNRTTWYGGGIQGIGWIGNRASVGLTDLPDIGVDGDNIAAHEMGHNLNRWHSPCDVTIDVDDRYPYDGGLIGQFGFDIGRFRVRPKTRSDVMGYCNSVWISDYTYKGLYNNQRNTASTPSTSLQNSLYARVQFDQQGNVEFMPLYTLFQSPDQPDPNSDYSIEFVDAQGEKIASYSVKVLRAAEPELTVQSIHAVLPLPKAPFYRLRLVRQQQIITEKYINVYGLSSDLPIPTMTQNESGWLLSWGNAGVAALVRYSTDGGQDWHTLDMDVYDGELLIMPEVLPPGELLFEIHLADQISLSQQMYWNNPINEVGTNP